MNLLTTLLIVVAALSADLVVETSAEIVADILLDENAGAIAAQVPGQLTEVVDMLPQATILWTKSE